MARIVHWGGQDYKVIDGSESYGPFDKQEAEKFLRELEDKNSPISYEDFDKAFGPLKAELKKGIAIDKIKEEERKAKLKAAGEAELKSLSFKKHFSNSQGLS